MFGGAGSSRMPVHMDRCGGRSAYRDLNLLGPVNIVNTVSIQSECLIGKGGSCKN